MTFVEFSSESYTVSERERFVVLVINKKGVTQEDVPVIVNLMDGSARGKFINTLHFELLILIYLLHVRAQGVK